MGGVGLLGGARPGKGRAVAHLGPDAEWTIVPGGAAEIEHADDVIIPPDDVEVRGTLPGCGSTAGCRSSWNFHCSFPVRSDTA